MTAAAFSRQNDAGYHGKGGGGDGAMPLLRYHLLGIVQRIRGYISGIG